MLKSTVPIFKSISDVLILIILCTDIGGFDFTSFPILRLPNTNNVLQNLNNLQGYGSSLYHIYSLEGFKVFGRQYTIPDNSTQPPYFCSGVNRSRILCVITVSYPTHLTSCRGLKGLKFLEQPPSFLYVCFVGLVSLLLDLGEQC